MLELMGSEYLIDHVLYEYNENVERHAFRSYVGDLLKAIAESWNVRVNYRYDDVISKPQEDEKTADEIVLEVMSRGGLKGKTDGIDGTGSEAIAG